MPSSREYTEYIFEQLAQLEDVSHRAMMGEYVLYYRDKVIGGIYDDRLLVKPTDAALALMPDARQEIPYEGAKPMLLIEATEDIEFLQKLFEAMYPELPVPKRRKKSS